MSELTRSWFIDMLGTSFHTAFRKGTDCPQAHPIWKLIQEMPAKEWEAVLEWVADDFEESGLELKHA